MCNEVQVHYAHWRTVKFADWALSLRKLPEVDYVPPLGGEGGGMPIAEVLELDDRVRIVLANGQTFELTGVRRA